MSRYWYLATLLTISMQSFGQRIMIDDFLPVKSTTKLSTKKNDFLPTPSKATLYAIIPGAGQIYNRDYWKIPIVYLAIGGGIYSYYLNQLKYQDYLSAYRSFYDLDKNSIRFGSLLSDVNADSQRSVVTRNLFNTSSTYRKGTKDIIEKGKNYWRRNRNVAVIATSSIYVLSIVEANVAAHLKAFDVSDDLTFHIRPKITQPLILQPTPGVALTIDFK